MSQKKDSDFSAFVLLFCGLVVLGVVQWFVNDVWPTLRWWLWAGGIAAAIWAPFLYGAYLKAKRRGYPVEEAEKLQTLTVVTLWGFFNWVSGPHDDIYSLRYLGVALMSALAALAVFGAAVGAERITMSGVHRIRRWIELENLKRQNANEQASASGKKRGTDNSGRSTRSTAPSDDVAIALDVMGLTEPFSIEELNARRKKLLAQTHPDAGGSANLFRQVQSAYELLKSRL